jgi:hypothetical protein
MILRSGTTLIEVLVAIFITAIGLLGLLALFPLGAVNMALAIKNSRCGQAAANAAGVAETLNIRNDPLVVGDPGDVFVDDDSGKRPRANPDGPSYPVYVDPLGLNHGMPHYLGLKTPGIPRRTVSFVQPPPHASWTSFPAAVQRFTLLDDISFVKDGPYAGLASPPQGIVSSHGGSSAQPGAGVVQREGRYSWAYLLRRPRSSDKSVVELTIIVYSSRPTVFGQGENAYGPVTFDPNSNLVRVYWGAGEEKPAVRAGDWILDATLVKPAGASAGVSHQAPDPHGFFYRVVNVIEGSDGVKPYLDLELQTKPKLGTTQGVLVVLDGVAEVFEKGPGWRP